jgi:hypothetical protein
MTGPEKPRIIKAGKLRIRPEGSPAPTPTDRPKISFVRLAGFTQDDLRLMGGGRAGAGIARYIEEMFRLHSEGRIVEGTRVFGDELDAARSNPIPSVMGDKDN